MSRIIYPYVSLWYFWALFIYLQNF